MAFVTLLNSIFAAKKPILGSTGMTLRDNLLEVARGGDDAPRVEGRALGDVFLPMAVLPVAVSVEYLNLDRAGWIVIKGVISNSESLDLRVQFSSDNGATWGTEQSLGSFAALERFDVAFSMQSGAGRRLSGGTATFTVTVPTDCNAFALSSIGAGQARLFVTCLGGLE